MKYAYKRKIHISILLFLAIVLVFMSISLTYDDLPDFVIGEHNPVLRLIDKDFSDSLIVLPRTQNKQNYGAVSFAGSTLVSFRAREFVFVLLFTLQIIAFDRRQQIITLILQHFEGGKYKHSLSILPS